jgi:hypothetical protein
MKLDWDDGSGCHERGCRTDTAFGGHGDQVPLDQLIRGTPGAHPITSIDELRSGAFETDEEFDAFLAFVTESRHADLA